MKNDENSPHLLSRHDKRAIDISILHEALSIGQSKLLCKIQGGHSGSVWYRYHHINAYLFPFQYAADFFGEEVAHCHSASVYRYTVEYRVWSSKVHPFEDVWSECLVWNENPARYVRPSDDDCLAYIKSVYMTNET